MAESFYMELAEDLRTLCDPRVGEFSGGDRFLTERQIAERFDTTRPTANKALASLVGQGVLEFRRGVGTFVCESPPLSDVRPAASLADLAAAAKLVLTTRVLSYNTVRTQSVPDRIRERLRVGAKEPLLRIERLRVVDRYPVAYESLYLAKAVFPDLSRSDCRSSLVGLCEGHYKTPFGGLDQTIRADVADKELASLLDIPRGSPVFNISVTSFAQNGTRLWAGRVHIRGDSFEFSGRTAGPAASRPAVGRWLFD